MSVATSPQQSALHVCFVSLAAYPVFAPASPSLFGGAEVRAATFARGLAGCPGYRVSFLVYDEGQSRVERCGAVTLYATWHAVSPATSFLLRRAERTLENVQRRSGFPPIRINHYHPRLIWDLPLSLLFLLRRAVQRRGLQKFLTGTIAPDVVCCFGVNEASALAIEACHHTPRKSVLFIASDHEVSAREYYPGSFERGRMGEPGGLAWLAIARADHIVVQTARQQQALRARFARDSTVIKNPFDLGAAPWELPTPATRPWALWIGRAESVQKRPELCLELARLCPEIPFVMILNPTDRVIFQKIRDAAPPNVRIIERVPYAQMDAYYAQARVLVSTTAFEGFPNTFLQAGKHGVPILASEVDPDGFITRCGCGLVAGAAPEQLAAALRDLWCNAAKWQACSQSLRAYVESEHASAGRVAQLETLLHTPD